MGLFICGNGHGLAGVNPGVTSNGCYKWHISLDLVLWTTLECFHVVEINFGQFGDKKRRNKTFIGPKIWYIRIQNTCSWQRGLTFTSIYNKDYTVSDFWNHARIHWGQKNHLIVTDVRVNKYQLIEIYISLTLCIVWTCATYIILYHVYYVSLLDISTDLLTSTVAT